MTNNTLLFISNFFIGRYIEKSIGKSKVQLLFKGKYLCYLGTRKEDDTHIIINVQSLLFFTNLYWSREIGFAKSYIKGYFTTPDISETLLHLAQNRTTKLKDNKVFELYIKTLKLTNKTSIFFKKNYINITILEITFFRSG